MTVGRPPRGEGPAHITLRTTKSERLAWTTAATNAGRTLSDWLRGLANRAAKRVKETKR
jgi:hypothetical protein